MDDALLEKIQVIYQKTIDAPDFFAASDEVGLNSINFRCWALKEYGIWEPSAPPGELSILFFVWLDTSSFYKLMGAPLPGEFSLDWRKKFHTKAYEKESFFESILPAFRDWSDLNEGWR